MNIIHVFPAIRIEGGRTLLKKNLVNLFQMTSNEVWAKVLFKSINSEELRNKSAKKFISQFGDLKTYKEELIESYKFVLGK